MLQIHDGQCGLCTHFGEHHQTAPVLIQIRQSRQAPEDMVDECDLPRNSDVHLKVTPISGCDGFEPASQVH